MIAPEARAAEDARVARRRDRAARRWIVGVSAVSALSSTAMVLVLVLRADAVFFAMAEPLFTGAHPPHPMSADTRMAQCIGFGLFAGWSVSMAWTFASVPSSAMRPVARALLIGLTVWFVLDSGGCILSGAGWNAVPNAIYFVAMALPLSGLLRAERR